MQCVDAVRAMLGCEQRAGWLCRKQGKRTEVQSLTPGRAGRERNVIFAMNQAGIVPLFPN
jgi:hypothetical protein